MVQDKVHYQMHQADLAEAMMDIWSAVKRKSPKTSRLISSSWSAIALKSLKKKTFLWRVVRRGNQPQIGRLWIV
ncbi:MAG: hypothetical protein KKD47_09335 [Proteobacteria bacterium]|nr:hypothetical protein [Pseudomonadota bacterium]